MPRSGTIKYGNRAVMFCFVRYAHYLFGDGGVRVFYAVGMNNDELNSTMRSPKSAGKPLTA